MNECSVVFGRHSFERYAEKIVVGFQYALFHRVALYMLYAVDRAQHFHHDVVNAHRTGVSSVQCHEIGNGYMAAEAYHFVAYGVLETKHDAYRHNHHRQADGNTGGGYAYCRTAHFLLGVVG